MVKTRADHRPVGLFTKENMDADKTVPVLVKNNMDEDKPVPVAIIPTVRFICGPSKQ